MIAFRGSACAAAVVGDILNAASTLGPSEGSVTQQGHIRHFKSGPHTNLQQHSKKTYIKLCTQSSNLSGDEIHSVVIPSVFDSLYDTLLGFDAL